MKKQLKSIMFIVIGILAHLHTIHADAAPLALGVQGGFSFANISTPSEISSSSRTGFLIGANLEIPLASELLFLQPEVSFAQRGANLVDAQGVKVLAKYDSVEVPVFLKAKIGETARPYLFAGPNFIFNVSNKLEVETAGSTTSLSFNPRTVNVALDFGGGIELSSFFANLRYSLGITQLNDSSANWQSRGIQLLLGIKSSVSEGLIPRLSGG